MVIGGTTFLLDEQAGAAGGGGNLSFVGSMPHLAAEGGWVTTFTLVNKGSAAAQSSLDLVDDNGNLLALPLVFPQTNTSATTAEINQTINPNASFVTQATGPASTNYVVGSAQLYATATGLNGVDGFAIFHYNPSNQEAVVPMETRNAPSYLLAFDNTNGVLTGVAVANIASSSAAIPITIRNDAGAIVANGSIPSSLNLTPPESSLNANGHTSFVLSQAFPQTANIRGTIELDTPPGGQISALGIRYTPPGTTTTIPALAQVTAAGGAMAHLAVNGGWQTTFVLVNTGTSAASATLNFYGDNGAPLPLPLTFPQGAIASQSASTLTETIAPNASLWIQSTGSAAAALVTGSAQLSTNGNVGGFVIFRYNTNGQEAVVPLESRNAPAYVIAYDNTSGTATGIAINNASAQPVNVPATLRDGNGNTVATGSIALNGNGHTSFVLATEFPQTAGILGTVEFDAPAGATISVLGIRSPPALTFTTLPALAK